MRRRNYRRLSASPIWAANRRYYDRTGIDAWRTGTVPHYVTNSVALATAYARVALAFVRDGSPATRDAPLDILELGAGSGRFGFLFLTVLEAIERRAAVTRLPIRYVMTDATESTIGFWRRHEALAPFVRAGRLDFARFDAESDGILRLRHARHTIAPDTSVRRLIVIANYVFDGLRHDAFTLRQGRAHDYLATAVLPRRGRAADVSLAWRVGPPVTAPYPEAAFNAIIRDYAMMGAEGRVLFPVSALRCLERLAALAREDVLVLAADRGTSDAAEAIARPANLELARHGSLSLPVNFHALRTWVTHRGGQAFHPARKHRHLHVSALVLGARPGGWPETRAAYEETIGHGGPDQLYELRHALAGTADGLGAADLLAMIRLSGHDARVMAECIRPLWRHLAGAGARLRLQIRDTARAAWEHYFHLGEAYDLAFNLGLLLYETHAYVDAHAFFTESLRLYGENGATLWNRGLCEVALGKPDEAMASFQRARALAPDLYPAGLAMVKTPLNMGPSRQRTPKLPTGSRPSSAARDTGGPRRRRPGSRR
jgi:tetratricopeptide (TPR) repeat protein